MHKVTFKLENLEVYIRANKLSDVAWLIYEEFDWRIKKINGDQFIESTDSTGANIAEGYGRYHYLDSIKFLYNSKGPLYESKHWFDLLCQKNLIKNANNVKIYLNIYEELLPKLNGLINSIYKNKISPNSK